MRVLDRRVATVIRLFRDLFECEGRLFGNPVAGISDGVEGVQWNANYAKGIAWLGINLEGMLYDGWPVARLIERELSDPLLLSEYRDRDRVPSPETVTVSWRRDAWQRRSRPPIREARIFPTPIKLDQLTDGGWEQALLGARECLDPERGYRGRRKVEVTLARSHHGKIMDVSPHLWFGTPLERNDFHSMRQAKKKLEALHDFARHQARR